MGGHSLVRRLIACAILLLTVGLGVAFLANYDPTEITYEDALKEALERNDPRRCRTISQGRFWGDYFENVSSSRLWCVSEYTAIRGRLEDCLELHATKPESGQSQRHACIRGLAKVQRNLDACEAIDYPEGDSRSEYSSNYQYLCQFHAIWDVEQCGLVFDDLSGNDGLTEECVTRVAVNTLDAELCDELSVLEEIEACRWSVEQELLPPAGI